RRTGVDSADPGVGVRTAEKRHVKKTRAIEVGHVAGAADEKAAIFEAWDPGADHFSRRGSRRPRGGYKPRLPPSASSSHRPRPPAATSTCCRVFLSRWHRRAAASLETLPDRRR